MNPFPFFFELFLGWRYTRQTSRGQRNGFISFISAASMLGIALGVAALIIVLAVMNGFQKEVRDRMLSVIAHIEVLTPTDISPHEADKIQRALAGAIATEAHVVGSAPFLSAQGLLWQDDQVQGVMVRGVIPAQEPQVTAIQLPLQGLHAGGFGVVIGQELAQHLHVGLGDALTLMAASVQGGPLGLMPRFRRLHVVGLFNSGHYEYDAGLVLMHQTDAQALFGQGPQTHTGIRLRLDDLHTAPAFARRLQARLNLEELDVTVRSWADQNKTWFAAVQIEKRMMFIILALIVAVATFNLVSSLVMNVTEKQADIAILRTLGASPRSIMSLFIVQGFTIGLIGTALGLVLGLGVALNLDVIVPAIEHLVGAHFLPKDVYFIDHMPSDPRLGDVLPVLGLSLVLSMLATLYPSWKASRVDAAMALRYE
jgi:lipoprotein-releasing system permease protein